MDERTKLRTGYVGEDTPPREELLASYRRLASILESMLDAVIVANPDGTIRTVNRAALELLGYAEEEIIGQLIGIIFEEEEEEEEEEAFFRGIGLAKLVREEAARDVELTLLAKSGERIPVVFNGSVIRDEDGRLAAVVGVARDIRERKRAEKAIKLAYAELNQIFQTAADGMRVIDKDFNVLRINETFSTLSDISKEEAVSKKCYEVFRGPLCDTPDCTLTRILGGEERVECEIEKERIDGIRIPCILTATPFRGLGGELIGIVEDFKDITERVRAEEALKRRATQLATVGKVGRQIASLLELDPLLDRMVNLIRQAFNYRYVSVLLVDPAAGELALRAGAGYEVKPAKAVRLRVGEESICGWVAASGEPLLVGDVSQEPRYYPVEALADTRSELAVPIRVKDQVIGVLDVQSAELEAFDEDDLFTLQTLANQVGVAVENACLFEAEQRRRQELEGLQATMSSITAMLDLESLLQMIVKQGIELFNALAASLMLWDEREENLTIRASWGLSDEYVQEQRIPRERVYAAATPEGEFLSLVTPDLRQAPFGQLDLIKKEHLCTVLIAPLVKSGQPVGTLNIYSRDEPRQFTPHEIRLAETLADQAAIAIENARLYQETHRRAERLAVVNHVARAASATLHLDDLMETVYREVAPTFQADAFFIALYDEETDELDFRLRVDEGVREPPERRPVGTGLTGLIVTEREPLLIRNFEEEQHRLPRPAKLWGTMKAPASWLGVPMQIGDRVVGVICVQAYRPYAYGQDEQLLLSTIADQVGVAVENARLYEQAQQEIVERKRAEEELQRTTENLRKALGATIQAIALTVETKDPYTAGHQRRVADLARALAIELGLSREQIEGIRLAGVIHDIGKISVPGEILSKPGQLSAIEFSLIKIHPQAAYDILKTIEFPWPVAQIVLQHHERMDGSGYPQGLSGESILLEARILTVADVVEAMASRRPYRAPLGMDKALEEISQNRGVLYDPEVVGVCLKLFTEKGFTFE